MLGEDFQKSADYSKLTCERARRQAAITSAISYAEKRITALDRMGSTTHVDAQLIDARTYYGLTLFMAGDHVKSKEAIEPIIALTSNSNDKRCIAQIYLILGSYEYIVGENLAQAFQLLQKATQNAEEAGDIASGTLAQLFYGLGLCWDCEFEKGSEHIQKALFINEAAGVLWGVSVIKSYLSYYLYNHQGKIEEGFTTSLSALEIAECAGDVFSRSMAYVFHGVSCFYKGLFTAAEEHLLKGIDLCERIKLDSVSAIGHQILGHVYFETGNYNKARIHHKKVILLRRQTGIFPSSANLSKMALARTMLAAGGKDLDVPSLVQLLRTNKLRLCYGLMARDLADILVRLGEAYYDEAESWLQIAIRDHEGVGMKWALASDYKVFAQICRLLGAGAQEKEYLDKSWLLFHECGADGWCRRMETEMAETSK